MMASGGFLQGETRNGNAIDLQLGTDGTYVEIDVMSFIVLIPHTPVGLWLVVEKHGTSLNQGNLRDPSHRWQEALTKSHCLAVSNFVDPMAFCSFSCLPY